MQNRWVEGDTDVGNHNEVLGELCVCLCNFMDVLLQVGGNQCGTCVGVRCKLILRGMSFPSFSNPK